MRIKRVFKILFILILFFILGAFRDSFFVNVNNRLYQLYYGYTNFPIPAELQFITVFDYRTLYYLKYLFTALFFLAYFCITLACIKMLFKNKTYTKWVIYTYIGILILSALSMLWGYFITVRLGGAEYSFSRWLMGIAQSPLIAFFFCGAFKLYDNVQTINPKHSDK